MVCYYGSSRKMNMTTQNYGTFEGHPCVYDDREAWVTFDRGEGWRQLNLAEVTQFVRPMSEANFRASYPQLPSMPKAAFQGRE